MTVKIYRLVTKETNDVYVGSTKRKLSERLAVHKSQFKKYCKGTFKSYCSSFKIMMYDDIEIELLEECDINMTKKDILRREGYHIKDQDFCVNMQIAGRTDKEYREDNYEKIKKRMRKYAEDNKERIGKYQKKYREDNKEDLSNYRKEYQIKNKEYLNEVSRKYREDNRQKILKKEKEYREKNKEVRYEKAKEKIMCECGMEYRRSHKARHMKTKRHIEKMAGNYKEPMTKEEIRQKVNERGKQKIPCKHCDTLISRSAMSKHIKRKHPDE